jgi:hypothetical protein
LRLRKQANDVFRPESRSAPEKICNSRRRDYRSSFSVRSFFDAANQESWNFGSKFSHFYFLGQPDPGGVCAALQKGQFVASTQIRTRASHERPSTCTGQPRRSNGAFADDKHQALHRYGKAQYQHDGRQTELWKYGKTDHDG